MKQPEKVFTRRFAVVEEFGLTAVDITVEGFTPDYLEAVGDFSERFPDSNVICEMGALMRTRINWPDEWKNKARQAIRGDYEEMFGKGATDFRFRETP